MDQSTFTNNHRWDNDENVNLNANYETNYKKSSSNKNATGLTELHPNQLNSNKLFKTNKTSFQRPQKQVQNSVLKSAMKPELSTPRETGTSQHQNSFRERIDYFNRRSAESNSQFSFSDISVNDFSFADSFCETTSTSSVLFSCKTIKIQPEVGLQETKAQKHNDHNISKNSSGYMSNRTFSNTTISTNSTVSNSTFTKPILKPTIKKVTTFPAHGPKLPLTSPEKLLKHRICDHQFITDQFSYLRKREMKHHPRNYLKKQKEITNHVRLVITDWLCEVSFYNEHWSHLDVFPLSVALFDRVCSKLHFKSNKVQLVAGVSFMLASKMFDTIAPGLADMAFMMGKAFSCHDVKMWEIVTMKQFNFDLYMPVASDFYGSYMILSNCEPDFGKGCYKGENDQKMTNRSLSGIIMQFLSELCLFEYQLSVLFLVSETSLASILLLRLFVKVLQKEAHSEIRIHNSSNSRDYQSKSSNNSRECSNYHQIYTKLKFLESDLCHDVSHYGVLNPNLRIIAGGYGRESVITAMLGIHNAWRTLIQQQNFNGLKSKFLHEKHDRVNMKDKKKILSWILTEGFKVLRKEDVHDIRVEFD
jgi:hypothetical protein